MATQAVLECKQKKICGHEESGPLVLDKLCAGDHTGLFTVPGSAGRFCRFHLSDLGSWQRLATGIPTSSAFPCSVESQHGRGDGDKTAPYFSKVSAHGCIDMFYSMLSPTSAIFCLTILPEGQSLQSTAEWPIAPILPSLRP